MSEIKVIHDRQRNTISVSSHTCSIFLLHVYKHTKSNDGFLDDFLKISDGSRKVVERPDKRLQIFSENLRRLPKIFKDNWIFLRKNQ